MMTNIMIGYDWSSYVRIKKTVVEFSRQRHPRYMNTNHNLLITSFIHYF